MNVSPTWSAGQVKLLDMPRLITLSERFRQPADNETSVTPPHIIKGSPYKGAEGRRWAAFSNAHRRIVTIAMINSA